MKTWTAIKLIAFGLLLLAVGITIKIVSPYVSPESVRRLLMEELAAATGADVTVGAARLDLDGVVRAEDVAVALPGEAAPLLTCPRVSIAFSKFDLLRLHPVIQKVVLSRPSLNLAYLPDEGAWNIAALKPGRGGGAKPPEGFLSEGVTIEDAAVTLRHPGVFGDDAPRPYPGIYVVLRPDLTGVGLWQMNGRLLRGALGGTSVSGWFATGAEPAFTVNLSCGLLHAQEDTWHFIPYGRQVWEDYRPEGNLTVNAVVRSSPAGSVDFLVRVAVTDASARTKYWPARISSVNGTVDVTPSEVILQDIKGVIEPQEFGLAAAGNTPTPLGVSGVAHLHHGGYSLEIAAANVPLCRASVEEIPEVGRELWQRLKPSGLARVDLSLAASPKGELRYRAVAELESATLYPRESPLPLQQVSGTVVADNAAVRLRNVRGVIAQGAEAVPPALFSVEGLLNLKDKHSSLSMTVHGLRTDEQIVKAIPSVGERIWELLQPEMLVDASVVLQDVLDSGRMSFSALLELHSGRSRIALPFEEPARGGAEPAAGASRPEKLPLFLDQVNGTVVVNEDGVRLRNVRGVVAQEKAPQAPGVQPAPFSADGLLDLQGKRSSLSVTVHNVRTNERLVRAVPGSGDKIWEMFHPEVVVDASLQLRDMPESGRMSYSVLLNLHGGRAEPQFCSIPLDQTIGTIKVEENKVSVESFSATVDTGAVPEERARTISTMELRGTLDLAAEKAEFYVAARDLTLTKNLVTAIPAVGEEVWKQAAPKGVASLAGKVVYDAKAKDRSRYILDVDLRDVSLMPKFIPVPIDALSGQLLVTERRAVCNDFNGVTCGGHFEGAAVVYYGPEGETSSYGVRARFEQLELGELVRRISGKEAKLAGRLSGILDLGGILGEPPITGGKGSLSLTDGQLWGASFFIQLLDVLHLTVPAGQRAPARGDMTFALTGDQVVVHDFELQGGGLNLSGYGTVWLDGKLDLAMVAVGAPEKGRGIPLLSPMADWLLQAAERELVRLDVSGTISDPIFEHKLLSTIASPLTSLRSVLFSPIFGSASEAPPEN